jgi:transcriptional regulator with PAS, ATPase and Fis domain
VQCLNNLKQVVAGLAGGSFQAPQAPPAEASLPVLRHSEPASNPEVPRYMDLPQDDEETLDVDSAVEPDERLSLLDLELETIRRVLERHKGRRKNAAAELGISERTLYRKIKQFGLD